MSLRTYAEAYAHAGLSVHPLPPGEKKSRLPWAERQRVRMTEAEVTLHWTAHPDDNVAIITGQLSGIVVVDVDPSHGGDPTPFKGTTPTVARTRSGGWHFYYRHPGHHVKSCAGPNPALPGVDVRGDGGYVVAPGSKVPPGEYSWEPGSHVGIANTHALPSFKVVEGTIFVKSSAPAPSVPSTTERTGFVHHDEQGWMTRALMTGAPDGTQRQVMTQLAGYFAAKGIPSDIAYATIFSWACRQKQRPGDPWMPHHVQDLVESIYDREAKRAATADPPVGSGSTTVGAPPAADDSGPGLMEAVQVDDFVERYGNEQTPWLVEDWIPEGTVGMVQSPPGAYKTWLLLDVAASVASGSPFLQRYPVYRPGAVLFLQQEDPRTLLSSRVSLLRYAKEGTALGIKDPGSFWVGERIPLYLVTDGGFSFGNAASRERLVALLDNLHPALVLLDPLYTACPAGQFFIEMPQYIRWLRRLRDRHGCAFLLAHHTKKMNAELGDQGREQMFGSNLMNAAIESGWVVRPAGEKAVTIRRHFKVRGNIERKKFEFEISTEKFPPFVCTESDLDDPAVATEEKPQLDDVHQLVLATLRTEGPMTQTALVRRIEKPQQTVSRKVQQLVDKGLVVRQPGDKGKRPLLSVTPIKPEEVS